MNAPRWSATLELTGPDGTRWRTPFVPPRMGLGRAEHNALVLERDQAVSAEHCELCAEDGWFVVRDLGSANGTLVNGARVSEARLRDGDEVRAGSTKIRVRVQGRLRGAMDPRVLRAGLLLAALAGLLAAGLFGRAQLAARAERLRARYVAQARALLQRDPCAAAAGPLGQLAALDARLAGRSVAIGLVRGEVSLSAADRRNDAELLALYQEKLALYAKALAQLSYQQQAQREALERAGRLAERLESGDQRKVAAWAQAQLGERLAAGDALLLGLQELSEETRRFAGLVEAVALRGEAPLAAQLAHFRFARDDASLVRTCTDASSRAAASASSALSD